MKVSIITTCYNRRYTILNALDSVIEQDYFDIEYIVIDGGSTDGSVEIIKSYQSYLTTFISEKDDGIYNALNKGIINSSGDIIGLLHSDDIFYDDSTISEIIEVFNNTNADIVYANGFYTDYLKLDKIKRVYVSKPFKGAYLKFGWIPLHTTIFVKAEVFKKYGLYRENLGIASDYEISLRWFTNPNLKKEFLDRWVVKMRMGGKSTSIKNQFRKSKEDLEIIKEYKLLGYFTLLNKIIRKLPQYILPKIIKFS